MLTADIRITDDSQYEGRVRDVVSGGAVELFRCVTPIIDATTALTSAFLQGRGRNGDEAADARVLIAYKSRGENGPGG